MLGGDKLIIDFEFSHFDIKNLNLKFISLLILPHKFVFNTGFEIFLSSNISVVSSI